MNSDRAPFLIWSTPPFLVSISHTGRLTSSSQLYSVALKQARAFEVPDPLIMVDVVESLVRNKNYSFKKLKLNSKTNQKMKIFFICICEKFKY